MLNDKTSTEDLKERLTQEEIRKASIQNQKKKGNKLETGMKIGKGIMKAVEKM